MKCYSEKNKKAAYMVLDNLQKKWTNSNSFSRILYSPLNL